MAVMGQQLAWDIPDMTGSVWHPSDRNGAIRVQVYPFG